MGIKALSIPSHDANATPWLVSENDDVWDNSKIDSEKELFKLDRHPVTDAYHMGETRYDLDAPITLPDDRIVTVRDYWRAGVEPARFKLRRLNSDESATANDMLARGQRSAGYQYAAKRGLTGIEGVEGVKFKKDRGGVDEKLVELLHRAGVLIEIGAAVMLLSRPMEAAEKK